MKPHRKLRKDEQYIDGHIVRITPEKQRLMDEIDHIYMTSPKIALHDSFE